MTNSVYIHIPFCDTLCYYCDFTKLINCNKYVADYLLELEAEIIQNYNGELIETLYIGGGTPSSLSCLQLKQLFKIIKYFRFSNNLEFSFECNVENLTAEKLQLLYDNGVNRLSIGVQTFNEKLLTIINRKHHYNEILTTINLAYNIGFKNINIDLIFNLPTQTLAMLKDDLQLFLALDIEHISIYNLTLETKSVFYHQQVTIDDDLGATMYEYIIDTLVAHGYCHYEISNFSKPSYESKHNLVYWDAKEYYGFGMGAHGYLNHHRYSNTTSLKQYLANNWRVSEYLDEQSRMSEFIILGLRKLAGIDLALFQTLFQINLFKYYDVSDLLDKHLEVENNYLKLTRHGLMYANDVFIRFLED